MSLPFTDGAAFSDGSSFRLWRPHVFAIIARRPLLAFNDGAARSRFIEGLAARPMFSRLPWPVEVEGRRVSVNPRCVSRAVEYGHGGRPGFVLEGPRGRPFAWVPATVWQEAAD